MSQTVVPKKNTHKPNSLACNNGVSLIEVMIVMSVSLLIGVGSISLMNNMLVTQERAKTTNNMGTFLINLENNLKNPRAWEKTVAFAPAGPTSLRCMDEDPTTLCNHVPLPPGVTINNMLYPPQAPNPGNGPFIVYTEDTTNLRPANQLLFYDATTPSNGFTLDGTPCNTYNAGAGDDNCPFRYDLTWFADCPNTAAACQRPQVIVVGTFRNNPASKGEPRFRINTQGLNFSMRVGEKMHRSSFIVSQFEDGTTSAGPPAVGTGGGACINGTPTIRPLNTYRDPGDGMMDFDDAADRFRLDIGSYSCSVTAQVYSAPHGAKIFLADTSGTHNYQIGSGSSPNGSTTIIKGSVNFNLQTPRWFQVNHLSNSCDVPPAGLANNSFAMGIPVASNYTGALPSSYAGGTTFTTISCTRQY